MIGCWNVSRGLYEFRWGEISSRRGMGIEYSVYHETASIKLMLLFFTVYIKMPMIIQQRLGTEDWIAAFGIGLDSEALRMNWRTWHKGFDLPWTYKFHKREILDQEGNVLLTDYGRGPKHPTYVSFDVISLVKNLASKDFQYTYVLRDGTVQNRIAKVHMERDYRKIRGLPFVKKSSRCIWAEFDGEVGERTGSWKGGCTGCGYTMLPNETIEQCLRRMERERKFLD
jgi:hypothetical protein